MADYASETKFRIPLVHEDHRCNHSWLTLPRTDGAQSVENADGICHRQVQHVHTQIKGLAKHTASPGVVKSNRLKQ